MSNLTFIELYFAHSYLQQRWRSRHENDVDTTRAPPQLPSRAVNIRHLQRVSLQGRHRWKTEGYSGGCVLDLDNNHIRTWKRLGEREDEGGVGVGKSLSSEREKRTNDKLLGKLKNKYIKRKIK